MIGARQAMLALAFVSGLAALDAASAICPANEGSIEVRMTDHAAGIGAFASLTVSLEEVAVHRRGAARHEDWIVIAEGTGAVDIVPLKEGRWVAAARTRLAAGAYQAVRIRFAAIEGRFHQGRSHPVVGQDAVIAMPLVMPPDGFRAILLDLFVEDQTDHAPPRFVVKLRRVEGQER